MEGIYPNLDCKTPNDLLTFFNGDKAVLNIEAHMERADRATKKDKQTKQDIEYVLSPYTLYAPYARFKFTYIDKTGPKTECYTANIKPDEIPDIVRRTDFAAQKIYEVELNGACVVSESGEKVDSPAYTVRIKSGALKGKTPAEVMQEPGGSEKLNNQYKWLKDNLEKYPSNKEQMDAIVDAANLVQAGKLVKTQSKASKITILSPEMRPLQQQKREDGLTFVYEIGIYCYPENKYPYQIVIDNYYAPVVKGEDGRLNVHKKDRDVNSHVSKSFNLTTKDFHLLISRMQGHMRIFEDAIGKTQLNVAVYYSRKNRTANKEEKGQAS